MKVILMMLAAQRSHVVTGVVLGTIVGAGYGLLAPMAPLNNSLVLGLVITFAAIAISRSLYNYASCILGDDDGDL
jgi:hypothetical protein